MTRILAELVADYLRLAPGDREGYELWRCRVEEAFPYGREVLTCKLGELVGERLGWQDAMGRRESA